MKHLTNRVDISLSELTASVQEFIDKPKNDLILFYAPNGTGKTRLSREFTNNNRSESNDGEYLSHTLYFNSLTEDLFTWENELRILRLDRNYNFVSNLELGDPEGSIGIKWARYSDLDFSIRNTSDFQKADFWEIEFFPIGRNEDSLSIKISRAEERLFIWSFFEVILEKVIESDEGYKDIKYIYIDDPISSMDENSAVKFAMNLVEKVKKGIANGKKFIISSHHSLFFNVIYNNLKARDKSFIIGKNQDNYTITSTNDKIFMSHVALMKEIEKAIEEDSLSQHHFGNLRIIFEKTAVFLGHSNFSACIREEGDRELFSQALNLWSHGNHSIFEISQLLPEQKDLLIRIFNSFKEDYNFKLGSNLKDAK